MVCLLPYGSANERVKGISHLFEHILISELCLRYKPLKIRGYTTEDYVVLFCTNITSREVVQTLQQKSFIKEDLELDKKDLIEEIKSESSKEEEAFFSFVWQGTVYEKSPLGTVKGVDTITSIMLRDFRAELLKNRLFFYNCSCGLQIINRDEFTPSFSPGLIISHRRYKAFQGKHYNIFYFNHSIESLHLLLKILKDLNPDKHIQLSEKKEKSALIFETGTRFPTNCHMEPLRERALLGLRHDLSIIKINVKERALNELESVYFYDRSWRQRIKKLFQTTNRQLLEMVEKIKT